MRRIKTDEDIPHSTAELCLNLWYFVDDSGIAVRIAGKAYALRGSDNEKLAALHQMAGTDYLTATQGKIPERFVIHTEHGELRGVAPFQLLQENDANIYGDLIDQIERELPKGIRSVSGNYELFTLKIPQDPLIVTTGVYEREDGELVARIGKRN